MKKGIVSITPAAPGWTAAYRFNGGIMKLPIACFALVKIQYEELEGEDGDPWAVVKAMIADPSDFELIEADRVSDMGAECGDYIGIAAPGESEPGAIWDHHVDSYPFNTSRQLHETPDSAPQAID